MNNIQVSLNEAGANSANSRVYGTPTIAELKRRVLVRQLEKEKRMSRKKHRV